MKDSLKILLFFTCGILTGIFVKIEFDISMPLVYLLVFFVGISVGANEKLKEILEDFDISLVIVPLSVLVSSILGGFISGMISKLIFKTYNIKECIAVSLGFGYYSLSSIIISKIYNSGLGVIALLSNILREVLTLILSPIISNFFGKYSIIMCGGATSMDTTLPMVKKYSGEHFVILSFVNGVILSLLVPILIPLVLS